MEVVDMIDDLLIDEDVEMYVYLNPRARKLRLVRERPPHFDQWDEVEFKRRFRLQKDTVEFILSLIEDKIKCTTDRNQCIAPMLQLLIALRFYASGSFYITIGDFCGVHNSTICNIVKKVTDAIASLRPRFVKLPNDNEEIAKVQQEFYSIARFPRVVSALDCTHIRIISPGGDTAENFRNRKGYFSINVQAMCTANLKIQNVVARWPGSTHDSLIFLNSAAKHYFDNKHFGNGVILGDSGYFLNEYLLTPYADPRTQSQSLYNESHIRTRNTIERCFGVWKRRFPVLSIGMRCKLPLVQDIIVATAVLHNLAIDRREDEPPVDPAIQVQVDPLFEVVRPDVADNNNNTRETLLEYFQHLRN